jgi:acetolactate synthase-1/2/3 large subunit
VFLNELLQHSDAIGRTSKKDVAVRLARYRQDDRAEHGKVYATCGVDPVAFLLALRRAMCADGLLFVDVSVTEHWAAEAFPVTRARTYFNPTDNQSMGWTVPAAIGASRVLPGRQVVAVTGDGCFLMSAMEVSTAAREGLPVKFFVFDDQAYRYMQILQEQAYKRTTATMLARLDYAALAKGLGVGHVELDSGCDLEAALRGVLALPGPVLVNVRVDHGKRPMRWIKAVRGRFTEELSTGQKMRFLARMGARSLAIEPQDD